MTRWRQFWTLARLTFAEALRQPVNLLLAATCVVLTGLLPLIFMHNFGEEGRLARDTGFAFHFIFGVFIAGYAASSCLAREIASGTASVVLSKPVSRDMLFGAKCAGIAGVVMAFSACQVVATLLGERISERFVPELADTGGYIVDTTTAFTLVLTPLAAFAVAGVINYRTRRPFEAAAFAAMMVGLCIVFVALGFIDRSGHPAAFDFRVDWRIVPVSVLIGMALVMLSTLALVLSTRLPTAPTLLVCAAVFVAGLLSDHVAATGSSWAVRAFHLVAPNWQRFWLSDALSNGGTVPWSYVACAGQYALVWTAGVLCLGMAIFRRTDMK